MELFPRQNDTISNKKIARSVSGRYGDKHSQIYHSRDFLDKMIVLVIKE
jgi:hypothetical protein